MSSWVGIESSPDAERSAPDVSPTAPSDPLTRAWRLRRHQRPTIGSLDAAGVLVQSNAREIVLGSAWILVPGVGLGLAATTMAFDRYQTLKGSTVSIPELLGGERAATGVEELLWYVGLVVASLAACVVGGYVATLVVQRRTGQALRVRTAYRSLVRRIPALTVAWALGHCWFPLAVLMLANVSDSALAPLAILASPLVLVASTFTLTAAPVIVIEGLGPIAGLRRSWRLARTRFGLAFGFVVASVVIGLLIQYGIAYLPRLMQATGLVSFGRFGWLIEGVAGQLGRLISTPLVATATALVYLEIRMTVEGMDIVVEADRAFGVRE